MSSHVLQKLDQEIIASWKRMRNEYNNMWLRREGSLVSSFYYHFRKRFKKSFFIERIF